MNTLIRLYLFLSAICLCTSCTTGNTGHEKKLIRTIESILSDKQATVGVAIATPQGHLTVINDTVHYPLLSVFKFHVALAVLNKMDVQHTALDSVLTIHPHQLSPHTYSPLYKLKDNQEFDISIAELLTYSVAHSDNNACDILIEYAGGTAAIDHYIQHLGIENTHIGATEKEMNTYTTHQRINWSTPSTTLRLMQLFVEKPILSSVYKDFLIETMIGTTTGKDKLRGLLPAQTTVAHKTGSSDRTAEGVKIADNDAGFIYLNDGEVYYITVFVKDSKEDDATNANIIAEISKAAYDYMIAIH